MKTKFYFFLLSLMCSLLSLSAQEIRFNTMLIEEWVKTGWRNAGKIENTYDPLGPLAKQDYFEWDTVSNIWIKIIIITNKIDANGTISESLSQMWDEDENKWMNFSKTAYTYNAAKDVTTATTYMDIGMGWMAFFKTTSEYNSSNQLTKELEQSADLLNPTVIKNSSQTLYTYNSDGLYQSLQQEWNEGTSAWVNQFRSSYSYASKKVISVLEENFEGGGWVNSSKQTLSYNGEDLSQELDQKWNPQTSAWENDGKDMYTYSGGNLHVILSQQWNKLSSAWVNESRTTFSPITAILQQVMPDQPFVRVYPNPFREEITIETSREYLTSFRIFNSAGQMVSVFVADGLKTRLDLGSLSRGTYFLRAVSGNDQQTIKIIKQNKMF